MADSPSPAELYIALALPPLPMHYTQFLKLGGAAAGTAVVEQSKVVALSDEAVDQLVWQAVRKGPLEAERRGAKLPFDKKFEPLIQAYLDRKVEAPKRGKVWQGTVQRMKAGEPVAHAERFKLLMSQLRANWSDEEIHEVFRYASNYDFKVTQGQIDHAKRRYLK